MESGTAPTPPTGDRRASAVAALERFSPVAALRMFLGALFITVFFENLAFTRYTEGGYARLITRYQERNDAPRFWSDGVMEFFADNAAVFSKLQAVTEMSFGLALVTGIATGFIALSAAAFLFSLWLSELGIFWIWELLSLTAIALVVGLSSLPSLLRPAPMRERVLGPPTFSSAAFPTRVAVAVAGGALLLAAVKAAGTAGNENDDVAYPASAVFLAALLALGALDTVRTRLQRPEAKARGSQR